VEVVDLSVRTFLSGGSGNDTLTGGAGEDLMVGGAGDDTITGAANNDFLIGGNGSDRIVGSAGNDILVAGDVGCSFTLGDLRSVLANWVLYKQPDDPTGEDILDETLVTDFSYDMLTGASGADWFIISQGDKVTDFKIVNKDGDVVTYV
jgi:Ca2+-binding RTX toxin-like protein